MKLLFSNLGRSTLAGPVSSSATTINLQAGGGAQFPNPTPGDEYFVITLIDAATRSIKEILHCTARTGDSLVVVRGQEGTTPLAWNAGDFARNLLTAGQMATISELNSTGSIFTGNDTSGSANAVAVSSTTPVNVAPLAGQLFLIRKNAQSNTGGVTVAIGTSPARSVVYKDGTPLGAADWPALAAALLYYNGSVFQFLACADNTPNIATVHTGTSVGTANALSATVRPAIAAYAPNQLFVITPNANNTGATTANLGPGARSIIRPDGAALVGGEIVSGRPIALMASGSQLVMLTPYLDFAGLPVGTPALSSVFAFYNGTNHRQTTLAEIAKVLPIRPSTEVGGWVTMMIWVASSGPPDAAGLVLGNNYSATALNTAVFPGTNGYFLGGAGLNGVNSGNITAYPNGLSAVDGTLTGTWKLVMWSIASTANDGTYSNFILTFTRVL